MEKKDDAGIRKVYSKDTLANFAEDMKAEKSKSLADYLSTDNVSTALCDIRNEVITGDTAIAEIKTAGMPNGVKVVFVKEGNEWKLTNKAPSLDAVKQTAPKNTSTK
jgi:di/tripeptidase